MIHFFSGTDYVICKPENVTLTSKKYPIHNDVSGLNNIAWGEISKLYSEYKNGEFENRSYVGLYHYRRKLNIEESEINDILHTHDIILPIPDDFTSFGLNVYSQFSIVHGKYLIDLLLSYISTYDENLYQIIKRYFDTSKMYLCNVFIMRGSEFSKYIEFLYNILSGFIKYLNIDETDESYKSFVVKHINEYPNPDVPDQCRFVGYIAERLSSFYFYTYFTAPYTVPMIVKW